MRVLVTGGEGSVGRDLVPALLGGGHEVVVLDRQPAEGPAAPGLRRIAGAVEDPDCVEKAMAGVEAVVHLAWSFAESPRALLDGDLRGHQLLLDVARAQGVRHFLYASSAVVYGKPLRTPLDEDHPLRVLEARKPSYGLAKEFAEKLTLLAERSGGPSSTVLRFWWAFGATIGGRHLREVLQAAAAGRRVDVPAGCGGSFLSAEDLARAVQLALGNPKAFGQVFNVASAYVGWDEVARMAIEATGSRAALEIVPVEGWRGPAFLADAWHLDDRRIRARLGYLPMRSPEETRAMLRRAISRTWEKIRSAPPPEGAARSAAPAPTPR